MINKSCAKSHNFYLKSTIPLLEGFYEHINYSILNHYHSLYFSSGNSLGEFGSNEYGYYWRFPNGNIFQWGYHNNGNYITFPIAFENKCVNVELTSTQTAWPGDERHPFIKEITNTQVRYEDRGVDQHYGLNPVYWSAFGY